VRMLAYIPVNPTGLLALAIEYDKAGRYEDEAAVLERYVASYERERTERQRPLWLRFSAPLTSGSSEKLELLRA
jgi:hypothetical protein